ncbi:MAG: sigma factor for late transcription [Methylophagaceae bacterium]|jgi:DNA-directed RNA polymerase specialized sigma24 family protein|tara:strand:- start:1376 stop:1930 length:555 start_codon:yes stop_codon:yes gene_type:complete
MAKKKNYVNNKDLLAALIAYGDLCKEAENCGDKNPQVPDYIGKCIMMIAQRLATRPNFSGYMYKEEMISDGIENCLQYIHNFNPEKSQNPFAYFTQIIWYAFLRRISKEKKQMYIKFKASQRQMFDSEVFDDSTGTMVGAILPDYISEFIDDFETKLKVKKEEAAERSAEAAANAAAEDKSDTK